MIDNTTAVAVINNMGTCHSRDCHSVGRQIWQFCANNNIWLTAAHIPGQTHSPQTENRAIFKVRIKNGNSIHYHYRMRLTL